MAVIQISKIQVRRGLQDNLPQLASGELGWSIDTGNLYIGNGTVSEGAPLPGVTQILTSNNDVLSAIQSYTFKGAESGYTSQTGPSLNAPIHRSLQNKFDEQISARDFGAVGDGSTDDTTALQRAIDQVFPKNYYTTVGVRRVLHIPAGVYATSANLLIPPYATIQGDGSRSTIIKLVSGYDPVIQFKDSRGNVGATIDTITSDAPFQININNLTLQTDQTADIASLDSCQIVTFSGVRFQGNNTDPVTSDAYSAVKLLDSVAPTNKVTFDNCEFARITNAIWMEGDVYDVLVNNSKFDTLNRGIMLQDNGSAPYGVKVLSSTFDNIAFQAIYAYNDSFTSNASSYTSAFNHFKSVGRSDGTVMDSGSVQTTILNFATPSSYSISDIFDDGIDDQAATIAQSSVTPATTVIATTSGTTRDYPGQITIIEDGSTVNVYTFSSSVTSAIIDYQISRNAKFRIGTIKLSHSIDGDTVVIDDEYSENADTGVTLNATGYTNNTAVLSYTSTSTGWAGQLSFNIRTFI